MIGTPTKTTFDGLACELLEVIVEPCVFILTQDRLYLYYYEADRTEVLNS